MPAGFLKLAVQGTGQKKMHKKSTQKAAVTVLQNAVRRKQRGKKTTINKLSRKVNRLAISQRGSLQINRQVLRWLAPDPPQQDPPYYFSAYQPSNIRPICFLHQAISNSSRAYTNRYLEPVPPATTPTLPSVEAGVWTPQPFPLTTTPYNLPPGQYGKFDQLQYQGSQTLGVSNDFTHLKTLYQIQCHAVNCRGYIDVFLVHPKKSFIRSVQQDISLPLGLSGFSFMSLGTNNMYSMNNMYYSCKRIRRKYFNTTAPTGGGAASEQYLCTNPDLDMQFTIKNRRSRQHIKAPELAEGAVLDSTDIPLHKQDWIIISTTIDNKDVSANNHLSFQIWRTPVWRDREGASS